MFYVTVVGVVGFVLVVAVLVYAYTMYQLARYTRRRILQAREHRRAVEEMGQAQAQRSVSDLSARSLPDLRLYLRDHRHQLQLEPQPRTHSATARAAASGEQCSGEEQEHVVVAHQRRPVMRAKSSLERRVENARRTSPQRSTHGVLQPPPLYRPSERQAQSSSALSGRSGANTRGSAAELDAGYDSRPGSSSTYSSSNSSSSRQSTLLSLFSRPHTGRSRPPSGRVVDLRAPASSGARGPVGDRAVRSALPNQSSTHEQQSSVPVHENSSVPLESPSFTASAPNSPGVGSDSGPRLGSGSRPGTSRPRSALERAFSFDSGTDSTAAAADAAEAADADTEVEAVSSRSYNNDYSDNEDGGRKRSRASTAVIVALHVKTALGLLVVLSITWTFGFFAIGGATTAFSYLFTISNAFAGLFILLFYGVFKRDVKMAILDFVARCRKRSQMRNKKLQQQKKKRKSSASASSCAETGTNAASRRARYRADEPFSSVADLSTSTHTLSTVAPLAADQNENADTAAAADADADSVSNADEQNADEDADYVEPAAPDSDPSSPTQAPVVIHLALSKEASSLSSTTLKLSSASDVLLRDSLSAPICRCAVRLLIVYCLQ